MIKVVVEKTLTENLLLVTRTVQSQFPFVHRFSLFYYCIFRIPQPGFAVLRPTTKYPKNVMINCNLILMYGN